ncbi:MAG TPA: metallophosphoesterase, partial [Chloroflexota bacterium]|nr:metallophosphoesterase [Chloroflexota bacterium]
MKNPARSRRAANQARIRHIAQAAQSDLDALAKLFEDDEIADDGTVPGRLQALLEATERRLIPGLQTAVPFGDTGFAGDQRPGGAGFRDPWLSSRNQVGHFLTAVGLRCVPQTVARPIPILGSIRAIVGAPCAMSDMEVALRLAIGHEKSPDPRTALPALARVLAAGAGAGCVAVAARAASRRPLIGVTLLLAALRQAQGILGGFRAQFRATTDGDLTAWEQALRQCGSAAQFNHDVVEAADSPLYAIAVSHREGNSIQDLRLTLVGWQLGRLIDAGAFAERVAVGAWIRRTLAPDESREGDQRRGAAKGRPRRRRRTRIAYTIADSAAARLGLTLFKRLQPPPRVQVTSYEVSVPRLPRELDGLRILHLSDLHVHPGSDLAWQTPELVAGVPHDLVCYTGDFIDVDRDLPDLARLLARMPSGAAYAVLGNHDHIPFGRAHLKGGNDTAALRAILAGVGIRVLTNEARPLFDGALYLAGVDDPA